MISYLVMVATDRKGNSLIKIAKMGKIDSNSVEKTIGSFIKFNNILLFSDSHPSIILLNNNKKLEHHTFVASKQHVNSLDNH